jgi:DNA-binding PadR family transcriptional regulator
MRQPGTLPFLLLGLINQQAMAGYDLRKLFRETPLRAYSSSPGAIYPALRALEARGYVRPAAASPGARERRALRITAGGRRALRDWLRTPVVNDANGWPPEGLFDAKLAFMSDFLEAGEMVSLMRAHLAAVDQQLAHVRAWAETHAGNTTPSARLALQHGIAKLEATARWLAATLRSLDTA